MGIFKNQSLLEIELNTHIDVGPATLVQIKYFKPSGTTGFWTADKSGKSKISYVVQTGDIDESGDWKFQPFVTIGGRVGPGRIVEEYISETI